MGDNRIIARCARGYEDVFAATTMIDINGTAVDHHFFTAYAPCTVVAVRVTPIVAGVDVGAVTGMVTRCQGTEAPSAGDSLLTATFDLKGTADTVISPTLTTTISSRTLAAGNRLAIDVTGTLTSVVCSVTVFLRWDA